MNPNGESRLDRMEGIMEFILDHQAQAEVRQVKIDEAIAALAARQDKGEARHKSEMAAIRKLIQVGMKMLAKQEELHGRHEGRLDRYDEILARLSAGQEELRASLKAFLDSMKKGTNGNN